MTLNAEPRPHDLIREIGRCDHRWGYAADRLDMNQQDRADIDKLINELHVEIDQAADLSRIARLRAIRALRRDLTALMKRRARVIEQGARIELEVAAVDSEIADLEGQLEELAQREGGLRVGSFLAARNRGWDGNVPNGVIEYASAASFAAGGTERASRAWAGKVEDRVVLAGSDWGYRWRLEPERGRRHYSEWRLSWTNGGEFYACQVQADSRHHDLYTEQPVWLIATGAPACEASLTKWPAWLYAMQAHQHERNSLLYAIEVLHQNYSPATSAAAPVG